MAQADATQRTTRTLAPIMVGSGLVTILIALVAGLIFGPLLYLIAVFAIVDFVLAYLYATRRIGPEVSDDH